MLKRKLKALHLILEISKVDSRTLKNVQAILLTLKTAADFLSGKQLMYRIKDQTRSSSAVYDILNKFEKNKIVETKKVKCQGPLKEKKLYTLTILGTLLVGALTENKSFIEEAYDKILPEYNDNPVNKFQKNVLDQTQKIFKDDFKDIDNIFLKGILRGFSESLDIKEIIYYANVELSPIALSVKKKTNKLKYLKKMQTVYT